MSSSQCFTISTAIQKWTCQMWEMWRLKSDEDQEVAVGSPVELVLRMLRNLDDVDPRVLFRQRASVMRSHGPFRNVLKLAPDEATWGNYRQDEARQERGWKLLELLPRMLLGGGLISTKLRAHFGAFSQGEWLQLLKARR